jgi:hypothetical protein
VRGTGATAAKADTGAATSWMRDRVVALELFAHQLTQERRRGLADERGRPAAASAADAHRDVERGASLSIFEIELRPMLGQQPDEAVVPRGDREVQRGLAGVVDRVDVSAGLQAQARGFEDVRLRRVLFLSERRQPA